MSKNTKKSIVDKNKMFWQRCQDKDFFHSNLQQDCAGVLTGLLIGKHATLCFYAWKLSLVLAYQNWKCNPTSAVHSLINEWHQQIVSQLYVLIVSILVTHLEWFELKTSLKRSKKYRFSFHKTLFLQHIFVV